MDTIDLDIYLTPNEVASVLGMKPQGVHKLCHSLDIETKVEGQRNPRIYPEDFLKILSEKGITPEKKIFSVHSVKGGVGKTTMVHALASRASAYGFKVLMVDLDKQANLTNSFGLYPDPEEPVTLFDVYQTLRESKKNIVKNVIFELTDYLHIIPASLALANFDVSLQMDSPNISRVFKNLLSPVVKQYDLIFLDLAPDFNRITLAAHSFADHAVIPVNMDKFALKGVEMTYDHLDYLYQEFEHSLTKSIVINKFDARHNLAFEIMSELSAEYQDDLCANAIPISKSIENSIANEDCVWTEKISKSPALEGFENVLKSLLALDQWKTTKKAKTSRPSAKKTKAQRKVRRSAHA